LSGNSPRLTVDRALTAGPQKANIVHACLFVP